MIKDLHFVSGKEGKIREAESILGISLQIAKLDLDEIQSLQLEEIVSHKAKQAFDILKKPVIVDDVGVYIQGWNGFPGPFIKFILKAGGNELLLRMMAAETNREVTIICALGFYDGRNLHICNGEVSARIATEERGQNGFGFDPIMIPHGYEQTFAEIGTEEKNKFSHRKLALEKLKQILSL